MISFIGRMDNHPTGEEKNLVCRLFGRPTGFPVLAVGPSRYKRRPVKWRKRSNQASAFARFITLVRLVVRPNFDFAFRTAAAPFLPTLRPA